MRSLASTWALLALLSAPGAQRARIEGLEVAVDRGQISASFRLENVFDQELVERIQTGLPTGFDFQFKVVRPLPIWPFATTRSIESTSFQAVAMYNAVTREYLVNYKQDGELIDSLVVLELGELESALTRFENVMLFSTDDIKSSRRLHVRARASIGSRSILFLIPTTLKTDWAESRRFRLRGEEG